MVCQYVRANKFSLSRFYFILVQSPSRDGGKACLDTTGSTSVTGSQPWRWTALSSTSQNCQTAATQQAAAAAAAVQAASLHANTAAAAGQLTSAGTAAATQHLAAQQGINYAAQVRRSLTLNLYTLIY